MTIDHIGLLLQSKLVFPEIYKYRIQIIDGWPFHRENEILQTQFPTKCFIQRSFNCEIL